MLLFNGSLHPVTDRSGSFYAKVYHAVLDQCEELGIPVTQVDLSQTNLPFLDPFNIEKNEAVDEFLKTFTEKSVLPDRVYNNFSPLEDFAAT